MHVVICSLVKNGMKYLPAYRKQLEALVLPENATWTLCILEGDSNDGTWDYLVQWAAECDNIVIGQEDVGETTAGEGIDGRAERWARAGNACLDLTCSVENFTHVLWLESDLCFPLDLLSRLLSCDVDIVAPMIWIGGIFYDTWGFRDLSGRKWSNYPPYHPQYRANSLLEMGSVGSCVLFRREIFDAGIRFRGPYESGLLVGVSNDARSKGFRVFVDASTAILHPVSLWADQMWSVTCIRVIDMCNVEDTIRREEWGSYGVEQHLLTLTPESLVKDQQKLLKKIFDLRKANHVEITIDMAPAPSRKYAIIIRIAPSRRMFIPILYTIFLKTVKYIPLNTHIKDDQVMLGNRLLSSLLPLSCKVTLSRSFTF